MSDPVTFPELIIGTAGPIGVDMDGLAEAISGALKTAGYEAESIKLTSEMMRLKPENPPPQPAHGKAAEYNWKMDFANALRKTFEKPDTLARLAVYVIREKRKIRNDFLIKIGLYNGDPPEKTEEAPLTKTAFIIRQIKHPDEVILLRQIYGKQFIFISAYADEEKRKRKLYEDIKISASTTALKSDVECSALRLIERDSSETGEKLGQQLREAFQLADFFVDGLSKEKMRADIARFVAAFFGKNDITPTKEEYGMYAAKSASLRSSDLSRQVGAAIFSRRGELVVQGCNEVPKFGGGTYWEGEQPDNRDVKKGFDPNDKQKREVLRDIVERLRLSGGLSEALTAKGNDATIVEILTAKTDLETGALRDSWLMDLTEFGRIVHAEMCAICDAARLGRSVEKCTLFVTTFPCHNCTKHLIASGIYMEPYPKSRAKELHEDEIELETDQSPSRVSFVPFLGVSPQRYRDIFQKGRRKSGSGGAAAWNAGYPRPMLDIGFPAYTITSEPWAIYPLIGKVMPAVEG